MVFCRVYLILVLNVLDPCELPTTWGETTFMSAILFQSWKAWSVLAEKGFRVRPTSTENVPRAGTMKKLALRVENALKNEMHRQEKRI
jgi:hypothetical protein